MALLCLVLVMLINVAVNFAAPGPPQCWVFTSTFDGWSNVGFTSSIYPPTTYGIPAWTPPANYAYVQTATSTSFTGELRLAVQINDGDVISANLFRHEVIVDSNDRIDLKFQTAGLTKDLLVNGNYDIWEVVYETCGVGYTACCPVYPCTGDFIIDGFVLQSDELSAVEYVAINSGCGSGPPPPPPPPSCGVILYDCNFETSVCGWSLATESNGWHWSYDDGPPTNSKHPYFPAPPSANYIWVEDESSSVYSATISGVTDATVFYFDYYFDTSVPGTDTFEVLFEEQTTSIRTSLDTFGYSSGVWLYRQQFGPSTTLCGSAPVPCKGDILIITNNTPFNSLLLAIDNFEVCLH